MTRFGACSIRVSLCCLLVLVPASVRAGGLTFLGVEGVARPNVMAMSPDGLHIYTGNRVTEEMLSLLTRDPLTGSVTATASYVDGTDGVVGLEDPTSVVVSPDGRNVYVTGFRAHSIVTFTRDLGTGALTFLQMHADDDGTVPANTMRRPSSVVVSPDDLHVYVASGVDDAITLFTRDLVPMSATYGALTYVGRIENSCPTVCGLSNPEQIAITHDGSSLYVAAHTATTGSIVAFARDAGTGALTYLENEQNNLNGITALLNPVALALNENDDFLYTVSSLGDAVHVFSRDADPMSPDHGKITFVDVTQLGSKTQPVGIALDPSAGAPYVYVTGADKDTVFVLRRDPGSGKLALLQTATQTSLADPHGIVVAPPDGRFVYASTAKAPSVGTQGGVVAFQVNICGDSVRAPDEQCDDDNVTPGDGCDASCRIELCGPTPQTGCTTVYATTAEDSSIDVKNDPAKSDSKDKLIWAWKKGAIPPASFGDPRTAGDYVFCIYDGSPLPQPLVSQMAPRGTAKWKRVPSNPAKALQGYTYSDPTQLTPDGVSLVKLKGGTGTKAQIQVQGKSFFLRPPTLALTLPVTVELRSTQDPTVCWVATYGTNPMMFPKRLTAHTTARFKAKND
jgi:cysteine-rich repeat protein